MDSLLRVFLNGNFLANEPLGLPETELSIVRDEKLKGIFFSYTTELTFWGDGYDALRLIRDTDAGCAQVPCNIEFKCAETSGYEVLYEAVIPLGSEDVEWDEYNCTVKCRLENADFSNLLKTFGDVVIKINNPQTINNSDSLASITENLTQFFFDKTGGSVVNDVPNYLFTDVLQQALSFLSNNRITLIADPIYSTLYTPQILHFDFIDPLTVGDSIVCTFTNWYNQNYTVTFTAPLGSSGFIIDEFLVRLAHFIDTSTTGRTNAFEKANEIDQLGRDVVNYAPWSAFSISVNAGAKNATLLQTQAYQYGLKNLAVTTSTLLQGQTADVYVTLNDILTHATQLHNMGFRFSKNVSGNYDFNLTYLPDLLDNTATGVNLPEVAALKSQTSGTFNLVSLTTPQGQADTIFQPFTWYSENCYGETLKLEASGFSTQEFFDLSGSNKAQDDKLFYVFLLDGDYANVERFKTKFALLNPATGLSGFVHYNMPYAMPLIIKRNEIFFANKNPYGDIRLSAFDPVSTCPNCPEATITNENTIILKNIMSFDYPLSYTQVRAIIDNALQFVSFSDGRNVTKNGFVKEVTIPFKNFISSFELYTN